MLNELLTFHGGEHNNLQLKNGAVRFFFSFEHAVNHTMFNV
jgi:hypothetical protein